MSYSAENKQNFTGIAMFASVGLHAVLFVSMAFFPATSETIKKPLRIVNLLPPDQLPQGTPSSQAKTSTLQDILNNPLPDLSAGLPPLGNTSQPPPNLGDDNASSYAGNRPGRVNTALNWTNPPTQSFATNPSGSSSPVSPRQAPQTSSTITPAPSTPRTGPTPSSTGSLPDLPDVASAFPSPFANDPAPSNSPAPSTPSTAGDTAIGALTPDSGEKIPASKQRVVPIISEVVAFNYPEAACRDQLQGTATLSYFRQPDGSYVAGSENYEIKAEHSILNDAALNAVINAPAVGTGSYQRYSSRFDFLYSDAVCSATGEGAPSTTAEPLVPSEPSDEKPSESEPKSSNQEGPESEDSKSNDIDSTSNDIEETDKNSDDQTPPETKTSDTPGNSQSEQEEAQEPQTPASSSPTEVEPTVPEPPASTNTPPVIPASPSPAPSTEPESPANEGAASDLIAPEPAAPEPARPQAPIFPAEPLPSAPTLPAPAPSAPTPTPPTAEPEPQTPALDLPPAE